MDEFNKLVGRVTDAWAYLVAGTAAIAAAIGFGRKHYRRVRRAIALSDMLHDVLGDTAAKKITEEIKDWTRSGAVRELRVTLLEELLGAGIYVCEPIAGNCTQVNPVIAELFGLDRAAFRDSGWLDGIAPAERAKVHEVWTHCVKNRIPYEYEYTVRNQRTHREFKCISRAYPAMLADGTLLCYVGTVQEIK